jgi:hypothetical protein
MSPEQKAILNILDLRNSRNDSDYKNVVNLCAERDETSDRGPWTEEDDATIQALLAEYKSLRQESMNSINNRTNILMLGIAAVGALGGAAATLAKTSENGAAASSQTSDFLVGGILSIAIPTVCAFVFLVWMSRAFRAHRVGYFLASTVEAAINARLGRLAMTWEAALWTGILPRDELFGPSMMALVLILLIGAISPLVAVRLGGGSGCSTLARYLAFPCAVYILIITYVIWNRSRLRNIPLIQSVIYT